MSVQPVHHTLRSTEAFVRWFSAFLHSSFFSPSSPLTSICISRGCLESLPMIHAPPFVSTSTHTFGGQTTATETGAPHLRQLRHITCIPAHVIPRLLQSLSVKTNKRVRVARGSERSRRNPFIPPSGPTRKLRSSLLSTRPPSSHVSRYPWMCVPACCYSYGCLLTGCALWPPATPLLGLKQAQYANSSSTPNDSDPSSPLSLLHAAAPGGFTCDRQASSPMDCSLCCWLRDIAHRHKDRYAVHTIVLPTANTRTDPQSIPTGHCERWVVEPVS